jgi:hypothetical protein
MEGILAKRGAEMLNANMLRYFQDSSLLDDTALAYPQ